MNVLHVLSASGVVTVQDGGRPGLLAQGLSRGGAADPVALAEGAALLGQPAERAAIELMGGALTVRAEGSTRIALTGTPMRATLTEAAETMEPFDDAMAAVYAEKAGVDRAQAAGWMDAETWFNGEDAVAAGLADAFLAADVRSVEPEDGHKSALRRIDTLLAKQNVSRTERRALLSEITGGTPGATSHVMPRADNDWTAAMRSLTETLKR